MGELPGMAAAGGEATEFGLQLGRTEMQPGLLQSDGSLLFETQVEPYMDRAGLQRFRGDAVQGSPSEPFLYLSWRGPGSEGWLMRGKVSLSELTASAIAELSEPAVLETTIETLGHRPSHHVQVWAPAGRD
jgi:hypothetical protein